MTRRGWRRDRGAVRGHHDAHPRDRSSTSLGIATLGLLRWVGRPTRGGQALSVSSSAPIGIVVMEGDGIGPEITAATMEVVRAADHIFRLGLLFTPVTIGLAALRA